MVKRSTIYFVCSAVAFINLMRSFLTLMDGHDVHFPGDIEVPIRLLNGYSVERVRHFTESAIPYPTEWLRSKLSYPRNSVEDCMHGCTTIIVPARQ